MKVINNLISRIRSFLISKKETILYKIAKFIFLKLIGLKSNLKITLNVFETFVLILILPLFHIFFKLYFQGSRFKRKSDFINVILMYSEYLYYRKKSKKNISSSNFLSSENYFLKNTLKKINETNIICFYYDFLINRIPILGDLYLLFLCYKNNIQYLLISTYDPIKVSGTPRLFTLEFISKNLNIKLISFWWDSVHDNFYKANKRLISMSFKNIYGDTSLIRPFYRSRKKDLNLGPAIDPSLICFKEFKKKDIDVIFLGSLDSYRSYRNEYINELNILKLSGKNILIGGGNGAKRLTLEEYFNLLGRSKICVNFSESTQGKHQLKGRVYESMASKCLLLESFNNQISELFDQDLDYISFSGPLDMARKIKFYLKNNDLLVQIAETGNRKFNNEYDYRNYWKRILDI